MPLAIRFWKAGASCVASACDVGQVVARDAGAAVARWRRQIAHHLVDDAVRCRLASSSQRARADARVGQQVVDQLLHASRAVDGEADELVGVCVELALVAARQELGVRGHHAQRLLQVVRRHVGELLELGVRARQLRRRSA